jgi:hypothetical protein
MIKDPYRRKFLEKLTWACAGSFLGPLPSLNATEKNKNNVNPIGLIIDADTANEMMLSLLQGLWWNRDSILKGFAQLNGIPKHKHPMIQ